MCVDQPRHDGLAAKVNDLGLVTLEFLDVRVLTDRDKLAVLDCDGFDPRLLFVDGVDIAVGVDGIGDFHFCLRLLCRVFVLTRFVLLLGL